MTIDKSSAWLTLQQHQIELSPISLAEMFASNKQRFHELSFKHCDLLCDFSKQKINTQTIKLLSDLAQEAQLSQSIEDLFNGALVNKTEQRAALHTQLRHPQAHKPEVKRVLAQMGSFIDYLHSSKFTDIIVLGIGGSDLGPRLVCEALQPYKQTDRRLHFVANVDGDTINTLLQCLNPHTTLCIINSKTFTTIETLANAKLVKNWMQQHVATVAQQLVAVTANKKAALEYGISPDNIFEFWDWVGGRYSVWSAVGLPIAIAIGMHNFEKFLAGAHAMDQHFRTAPFTNNLPVLMALVGVWNINFNAYHTLAIKPYTDGLQLLPAYLQQLEMESNGKSAANNGDFVNYQTAPVIWGGVGCNGQHAYMQMLHQGTQIVPVDFLVAKSSVTGSQELQDLLVASCLGQSQALMLGRSAAETYKLCKGNRPSTTIMFDKMTPEILGSIIALYEHKVFVQGIIWQIQSFDQWGVQLGKDLIKDVLQIIEKRDLKNLDASTAGLLQHFFER
jgi:glucose-6-phosphate isomerase